MESYIEIIENEIKSISQELKKKQAVLKEVYSKLLKKIFFQILFFF